MAAVISECGQYRYFLSREAEQLFPGKGTALFLMLNPSTADATLDDPTIRRCKAFAKSWDCNGMAVANLYALRATNPDDLWLHHDPVGPDNDWRLSALAREYTDIVCAWGANAKRDRVSRVAQLLKESGARLWCLGTNKDGSPKHPLYLRADTKLIAWEQSE